MRMLCSLIGFCLLLALPTYAQEKRSEKKRAISSFATVLKRGDFCTRVPKGCILYTPNSYKDREVDKIQGTYLSWKDFLKKNRSWIYLQEVTEREAAGKDRIKPRVIRSWPTKGKMVIAVNRTDPISVKPNALKIDDESE